ncbi:unnamed protein product [Ectocarpus sp. 4 AP-2014]
MNAPHAERDIQKYRVNLLHIMSEYIGGNSPSEVNLSDNELRETEARVATILSGLHKDPLKEPSDRGCLDGAYHAILAMVNADHCARYMDFVVTQR